MTHKLPLDVQIGLAKPDELDAIWELYQRVYLDTYLDETAGLTEAKLRDFLASDNPYLPKNWQTYLETPSKQRTIYVARHNGQIVGMIAPVFVDGRYRITALYVAPEMQGHGIGTGLMRKALLHHGKVDVYVGIASHIIGDRAGFYEAFGFGIIDPGAVKKYAGDPMSYVEMIRPATTG